MDVRQALRVRSRQIPGRSISRRADPKLTFRQIDRLHARLERKSEGPEAMLGVDAVAIEFAWAARGDDEVGASDDGKPKRVFGSAICGVECKQAMTRFGSPPAANIFAPTQRFRTGTPRRADSSASTLTISRDVRGPQLVARPASS